MDAYQAVLEGVGEEGQALAQDTVAGNSSQTCLHGSQIAGLVLRANSVALQYTIKGLGPA